MHCDDKRTLFVLKQEIEKTWDELKEVDFNNEELINKLSEKFKNILSTKIHLQIKNMNYDKITLTSLINDQ